MQRSKLWGHRDDLSFVLNILKIQLENTQEEIKSGECSKAVLDLNMDNCILFESAINKIEQLKEREANETCNS